MGCVDPLVLGLLRGVPFSRRPLRLSPRSSSLCSQKLSRDAQSMRTGMNSTRNSFQEAMIIREVLGTRLRKEQARKGCSTTDGHASRW